MAVLSGNSSWLKRFRNHVGSRHARFTYFLLARDVKPGNGEVRRCALPLRECPGKDPPVQVSHRYGKKTETLFQKEESFASCDIDLWRAETHYIRPCQIRIHAFESGLELPGDSLWGRCPPLYREQFHRRSSRTLTPFWEGPPVLLSEMEWVCSHEGEPDLPESLRQKTPPVWNELLKKLRSKNRFKKALQHG